jgi:serine kinase of HPr protein (carbohydrate metabolism regulator)
LATAGSLVHGSAVALGDLGVLIRGKPGSGKSDLALRLVLGPALKAAGNAAFALVADDQVILTPTGDRLAMSAPQPIRGLIEVRGVGLLDLGEASEARLALVVDLVEHASVSRLPGPTETSTSVLGVTVPFLRLWPFETSAPLKIAVALTMRRRLLPDVAGDPA